MCAAIGREIILQKLGSISMPRFLFMQLQPLATPKQCSCPFVGRGPLWGGPTTGDVENTWYFCARRLILMSIIIVEASKNNQCFLLLQMEFEFVFGSLSCCCNVSLCCGNKILNFSEKTVLRCLWLSCYNCIPECVLDVHEFTIFELLVLQKNIMMVQIAWRKSRSVWYGKWICNTAVANFSMLVYVKCLDRKTLLMI